MNINNLPVNVFIYNYARQHKQKTHKLTSKTKIGKRKFLFRDKYISDI